MEKEKYVPAEVEIIDFVTGDILLISKYEDDELPLNSNKP